MLANSNNLTNDLYDPDTGQQLFQPKLVSKAPQHGRAPGQKAHENLYRAG